MNLIKNRVFVVVLYKDGPNPKCVQRSESAQGPMMKRCIDQELDIDQDHH